MPEQDDIGEATAELGARDEAAILMF